MTNVGHLSLSREAIRVLKRLNAIYVDRSLVVLNKPPGLKMQGTKSSDAFKKLGTIQPVMDELAEVLKLQQPLRTIHRLDKDTTGLLLLARNAHTVTELHSQMERRTAEKTYYALVHDTALRNQSDSSISQNNLGKESGRELSIQRGHILQPLMIGKNGRVSADGPTPALKLPSVVKPASTHWELVNQSHVRNVSLLRLNPETGYKHQLRIHLSSVLQCPIVGDDKYTLPTHPPPSNLREATQEPSQDMLLHCYSLSFWRYKRQGSEKRFRLTITAPLQQPFLKACQSAGITLPPELKQGRALVNGDIADDETLASFSSGVYID